MDAATFKSNFPEFTTASDGQIDFFLSVAGGMLNPERWSDQLDYGTSLFVAHHLSVAIKNQNTALAGGIPGEVKGVLASKSIDKVSASYDASSVLYEGAGFWNSSSYGIRFWMMAKMVGAGGIQV